MKKILFQLQKKTLACIAIGIFCAVALGYSLSWMEQYWTMEDAVGSCEERFVVSAIVYYPYLPNTSAMGLVNPDVIISSERMSQLIGQQICRVVNIQTDSGIDIENYGNELI